MKYTVHFTNEKGDAMIGITETVIADSPQAAAKKFIENKKKFTPIAMLCGVGEKMNW